MLALRPGWTRRTRAWLRRSAATDGPSNTSAVVRAAPRGAAVTTAQTVRRSLDHPELLIFGVQPDTAAGVLNTLGQRIRSGGAILPGQIVAFDEWPHRIIPEEVPNPGEIVFSANRFYKRPPEASVPLLQLSYDDIAGRFPWEADYAAPAMQPRPGTFRA
jgi:hypothetical protein